MILVYRIEHKDTHVGPYQTDDVFTQFLARLLLRQSDVLPFPGKDELGAASICWFWVFGCINLVDLKKWFCLDGPACKTILSTLKEKGFVLAVYLSEKDDFKIGLSGMQVAFDSSNARSEGLVQYQDLETLLA